MHRESGRPVRPGRNAAIRLAAALPLLVLLQGCADVPPEYNPIEWGRSAARGIGSLFGGDEPDDRPPPVEPPPAEGRPYPNLATVPRPPKFAPRAEREAEVARLQADHDAAATYDSRLRGTGEIPAAPPPPPATSVAPAPAPAPESAVTAAPAPPVMSAPVATPPQTRSSPAVAQAGPPAATLLQRMGAVAFPRDGSMISEVGERALFDAAQVARANNGRVRLIPAQIARQAPSDTLLRVRQDAIVQALSGAGVPRERVRIDDGGGRRVDVYDLYVEY